MKRLLLAVALLAASLPALAQTPVPYRLSYQGRVADASGNLIGASSPVNRKVTFRIWKHATSVTAADRLYSEEQTVTITNGEFSVLIGAGTAIDSEPNLDSDRGVALARAFNDDNTGAPRYLGVTIDDPAIATDPEILPRQQFVSSAYAVKAALAQVANSVSTPLPAASIAAGAITAEKLGASAVTTDRVAVGAITTDKIADGTITSADLADGSVNYGKIAPNTVFSATIIDGEVTTGDIANSAVTTAKIADGAITREKLAAGAASFFNSSVTIRVADSDATANIANQLMLQDAADTNKQLTMGYDTGGFGTIQAVQWGTNYKPLKLNPNGGRVEVGSGGIDVAGKVTIGDYDLETRSGGFGFYHSTIKQFGSSGYDRDGPVVYGWNGGGLGTSSGTRKVALTWSDSGMVNFRAGSDYNTRLDVAYETDSWILAGHTTNVAHRKLKLNPYGGGVQTGGGAGAFAIGGNADGNYSATIHTVGTNGPLMAKNGNGVAILYIDQFGTVFNGSGYYLASDRRLKRDIAPLTGILDKMLALRSVTYEWIKPIDPKGGREIGFIAQEVEEIFPQWVRENNEGTKHVGMKGFEAVAVQAIRELRAEKDEQLRQRDATIATLEKNVAAMKAEADATKARLAKLERALATFTAASSND